MSALPSGWAVTTLGEITSKIGSGATPRGGGAAYHAAGVPLIRSMNVHFDGFHREGLVFLDAAQASALDGVSVCRGDVLLNITGASIGRVTTAPHDMHGARVNQHVSIVRPLPGLEAKYVAALLASPQMQRVIIDENYGVTRQALTKGMIEGFEVPLPPLSEQRRIVAKVDSLRARSARAREELDRIPKLIERYKQAILAKAFSGDLTADWRTNASTNDWEFEPAHLVCEKVQSGGTPKAGFIDTPGVPFLKVYNILHQKVEFHYKPQFVSEDTHAGELSKSKALPGDVIMNIVGPPLGKVAIIPDSYPAWNLNQALTMFRPGAKVSSRWIYWFLCGGHSVKSVINETRGSAGQVNISLTQCREFIIPVPPASEQVEILRRVERAFAWLDKMAAEHAGAARLLPKLDQAILAKAFRGELVPQDPNDEPASALLERIKAERAAAPMPGRGRRKATA
jgi:type I restriction enzyme, S subunit